MTSTLPTTARRTTRPPRRRVIVLNRLENRAPGRLAYALHRSRTTSRARSLAAYLLLQEWAEQRRRQLESERSNGAGTPDEPDSTTATDGHAASPSADRDDETSASSGDEVPTAEWTKGRIYELARELDVAGRSSMNKGELLEAVRQALGEDD